MTLDIIPYASAIRTDLIAGKTVVVIDVLRATSVMLTAFAHGALSFIPVETKEKALQKASTLPEGSFMLGGERYTRIVEGFNLGNSPLDYTHERVNGKHIILTTSNGTKALNALKGAKEIFIGAFLNAQAVTAKLSNSQNIALICSGTNNTFSMDDGMCAAMITDLLLKKHHVGLSDMAISLHKAYLSNTGKLKTLLKGCYHLNLLIRNGFEQDVDYCLQTGIFSFVPWMIGEKIIAKR